MNQKPLPKNEFFNIPDYYVELEADPKDPPYTTPYGYQADTVMTFVLVYPIHVKNVMPFGHPEILVEGIHNQLTEDQGLIEVKDGKTKTGRNYIYSIVKTSKGNGRGNQYNLSMHVFFNTYAMNITGFFDEVGVTGLRDAQVYGLLRNEGIINIDMEDWRRDPYDANYTKGHLMNRSEEEKFDSAFPGHPLTEARNFARFLIENN